MDEQHGGVDSAGVASAERVDRGARAGNSAAHRMLGVMREQLAQCEAVLGLADPPKVSGRGARRGGVRSRWPVVVAVLAAVGLQVMLPGRFAPGHRLVPGLELALLIGLVVANPHGANRSSRLLRRASVLLIAMITVTNAWSAARLVLQIVQGKQEDAVTLLAAGAAIWATNVIVFGLWYWHMDSGGPMAAARGTQGYPDFSFPQRQDPQQVPPDWQPAFIDYLYLAYTNATSFSPTDVMPYTTRAKLIMMLQSAVSLITIALVIARAIGLFK